MPNIRSCHREPLFERTLRPSVEFRTLAAMRDTLLPKLISGELRVKDAEKFIVEGRRDGRHEPDSG